jgi:hypothetical protein
MKRLNQWLLVAALTFITALGVNQLAAQDTNATPNADNNNNNQGRGGRQGRGNFDPARFQQMIMDNLKEKLEVKDDTEWKALEPLIQKVMDARRETMSGLGRGMFGRGGRPGGDNGGDQGNRRGGPFGQTPSPEADALDKAIEAKATKSELKAAIAKVQEARKTKQADLEKAQEDLRKVLTVRQEAIATSSGLL